MPIPYKALQALAAIGLLAVVVAFAYIKGHKAATAKAETERAAFVQAFKDKFVEEFTARTANNVSIIADLKGQNEKLKVAHAVSRDAVASLSKRISAASSYGLPAVGACAADAQPGSSDPQSNLSGSRGIQRGIDSTLPDATAKVIESLKSEALICADAMAAQADALEKIEGQTK